MTWAARAVRLKSACTAARYVPVPATGARRRRACCGTESPSPVFVVALVAGSSREREGATPSCLRIFALAPLVCKKRRVCRRTHRHDGYYCYVIAPGSGRGRARPQLAPPSSQCESCAFPSCSRDLPLSRSARAPPRPSRSTSRTVVSLNRGSRILGFDTRSGLRK